MPIDFICPHCGTQTQVADQYAGQTGPCASCGQTITVPVPTGVGGYAAPAAKKSTSTLPIVLAILGGVLVVVLVCGGILAALLLPAVQAARGAARRAQCINNMKQIGLALHNYNSAYGCFPPAYIADENGRPMHSWRVLILPFLEQQAIYDRYDFNEPWDGPNNRQLADTVVNVYRCPSDNNNVDETETDYLMVVGPNAFSDGPTARKVADITDGTSNTIMLVEMSNSGVNWMEPVDWDTTTASFTIDDGSPGELRSEHPGLVNVGFADGSVRSLSNDESPENLKAMTTINGGEMVNFNF